MVGQGCEAKGRRTGAGIPVNDRLLLVASGSVLRTESNTHVDNASVHGYGRTMTLTAMIARVNERFFLEVHGIAHEDNGIVIQYNAIVHEDHGIVLEDNGIVLEDNEIVLEDNVIVLEDNEIVLEDNVIVLEDNEIVLEDNVIVLEDNGIVLEDNETFLEDKAVVLEDNGVILVHDRSVPVYALGLPLTCAVVQRGRHTESATVCPVMPKGAIRWLFHRKPKLDKGSTLRSTGYPVGAVLPVSR